MGRKFKVISKTILDHSFAIGQVVELIEIYTDGVYAVKGEYKLSYGVTQIINDVHSDDLKEID